MTTDNRILYGGPDIPLVDGDAKCLGEMIQRRFNANASKICFVGEAVTIVLLKILLSYSDCFQVDAHSGRTMTVGELYAHSVQLAEKLQLDGVGAGDVIGLCSENRAEFPVILFAAFFVGATVAPLNTSYIEGISVSLITVILMSFEKTMAFRRTHTRTEFIKTKYYFHNFVHR